MNKALRRLGLALFVGAFAFTFVKTPHGQQPAPSTPQPAVYACPMHADVMTKQPGQCPKCQMALKSMPAPETAEYRVKLETEPRVVKAKSKVKLRFSVFHPQTGDQIKSFNVLHEMPFHLFVVSQDLSHFDHIHPARQADGSFTIETSLPKEGHYRIFCDLFPAGGLPQVIHLSLTTAGFAADVVASEASLTPDQELTKVVDGVRFELSFDPARPFAGKEAVLKYRLTDAETGQPVTDIQPYLGAWGHTLILSEDAADYLHSHPTEMIPENADRARLVSKPEVSFDTFFPRPGRYRIWSQFQRAGRVTTVSFTVYVPRLS